MDVTSLRLRSVDGAYKCGQKLNAPFDTAPTPAAPVPAGAPPAPTPTLGAASGAFSTTASAVVALSALLAVAFA